MAARAERIQGQGVTWSPVRMLGRPFEGMVEQLRFYRRALRALPSALQYRGVILSTVSDITIGVGALVVGAGTFFVIFSRAVVTGATLRLEWSHGLSLIV